MAVGIALSSDVLASAISAYTYGKIRILILKRTYNDGFRPCIYFYRKLHCKPSSVNHNGKFLGHHDLFLGVKFILKPVMATKESMSDVPAKKRAIQSLACGILIGFICGFVGAGGGMMMLLILTSVLGYELKLP